MSAELTTDAATVARSASEGPSDVSTATVPSVTDHRPPTTDHCVTDVSTATVPSVTDHRPPATDHCVTDVSTPTVPSVTDHRPPATDHCVTDVSTPTVPSVTDHRPPTTDHCVADTDHRPPTTDHCVTVTDHRPPTTDHCVAPTRVIQPRSGWQPVDLGELWRYRELLYFLVWRDVKVRYKQTVLGAAWAVIQPVMTMLVFTIFFGKFGGMDRHATAAFPVFVYAALLPWTYFAAAVNQSGQSLVSSANLVSKVYFPRLVIPLAACGCGLVDFAISSLVMGGLMAAYGVAFTPWLLLAPLFLLGTVVTAVGVGTLLSALVVAYRDFRYVMTFLVQLWMFASPVAYPLSIVPERWRLLYGLNPMAGMIAGFRSALLGEPFDWPVIAVSALAASAVLAVGLFYFRRVERRFADII